MYEELNILRSENKLEMGERNSKGRVFLDLRLRIIMKM